MEEYTKLGEEGALLTAEGWSKAQVYFLHASSPLNDVYVTEKHAPKVVWVKGDKAEVGQEYDPIGKIDSALRFTPAPQTQYMKFSIAFYLVLTDKHWEPGADGKEREVVHAPEWRIENPQARWTSVEAAIRYVREAGAKDKNTAVKENAARTIAVLKRYLPKNKSSGN